MKVNAIVVTRGDVDLSPIFDSFSAYGFKQGEVLVWNNSIMQDVSVYGRYAAIERSSADLIYVQDDDCVVSDPNALVRAWHESRETSWSDAQVLLHESPENLHRVRAGEHVVCNMPQEFRHEFYEDHALVGFGAVFHRDAPARAFAALEHARLVAAGGLCETIDETYNREQHFRRTCDIVFTALTPRVLVDVPKENLPWADAPNRLWKQPEHQAERARMLKLMKGVRDA